MLKGGCGAASAGGCGEEKFRGCGSKKRRACGSKKMGGGCKRKKPRYERSKSEGCGSGSSKSVANCGGIDDDVDLSESDENCDDDASTTCTAPQTDNETADGCGRCGNDDNLGETTCDGRDSSEEDDDDCNDDDGNDSCNAFEGMSDSGGEGASGCSTCSKNKTVSLLDSETRMLIAKFHKYLAEKKKRELMESAAMVRSKKKASLSVNDMQDILACFKGDSNAAEHPPASSSSSTTSSDDDCLALLL